MLRLIIMRHGRAENSHVHGDFHRALTPEGLAEADAAAAWLRQQGVQPQALLCSSAVRTRQTAVRVVCTAGWELEPLADASLYECDGEDILAAVAALPKSPQCVMVVGHNPTVSALAADLSDTPVSFGTSGVIVLDLQAEEWDFAAAFPARVVARRD